MPGAYVLGAKQQVLCCGREHSRVLEAMEDGSTIIFMRHCHALRASVEVTPGEAVVTAAAGSVTNAPNGSRLTTIALAGRSARAARPHEATDGSDGKRARREKKAFLPRKYKDNPRVIAS